MRTQDQRKLKPEVQFELRKQVVRLKNAGRSTVEVAEITGFARQTVDSICRKYRAGGVEAIKPRPRGRKVGEKRRLSPEQEKQLQRLMIDKTPAQFKFKFALWTRAAVAAVALRKFGVKLPLRTVSHYLKRWGFTVQKPTVRAYQQNPKDVSEWLTTTYPLIKLRAQKEDGEVHWGDETGVDTSDYAKGGFAPKGQTPVLIITGSPKKTRVNMISSITNQGKVRFMLYEGKMNSIVFLKFLSRLIKDSEKKVFLIVDNLRTHHSLEVKDWLSKKENRERIELFFLPSYSPELNPDERLNSDLKGLVRSGPLAYNRGQVKSKIRSGMKIIQSRPERVKKYFEDPKIAYAA